jgi:hypothetical protein
VGSGQIQIEHDDIRRQGIQSLHRLPTIGGDAHFETSTHQRRPKKFPKIGVKAVRHNR